jgi:hypothetical protein
MWEPMEAGFLEACGRRKDGVHRRRWSATRERHMALKHIQPGQCRSYCMARGSKVT